MPIYKSSLLLLLKKKTLKHTITGCWFYVVTVRNGYKGKLSI